MSLYNTCPAGILHSPQITAPRSRMSGWRTTVSRLSHFIHFIFPRLDHQSGAASRSEGNLEMSPEQCANQKCFPSSDNEIIDGVQSRQYSTRTELRSAPGDCRRFTVESKRLQRSHKRGERHRPRVHTLIRYSSSFHPAFPAAPHSSSHKVTRSVAANLRGPVTHRVLSVC